MTFWAWLILIAASALEVAGDALVRKGLRGNGWFWIVAGCLALCGYGMVVNLVRWDFSKLLGVYVGMFALFSVVVGRFVFSEEVPAATWLGLGLIVVGGVVIQLGNTTTW